MNKRLQNIREDMQKHAIDTALVSSTANITYLTGISYFSPLEREAYVLITKNKHYIFTDARYTTVVKKDAKEFTLVETSGKSKLADHVGKLTNGQTVGLECDDLSVTEYKSLGKNIQKKKNYSIINQRITKDKEEISCIEKACMLGDQAFSYILEKIKPGISEKELAFFLEFYLKEKGFDISFPPIIAFGEHAAVPHHQTGNAKLKSKDLVLLDFGTRVMNYCSDMTRTVFMGRATQQQKKMYNTVLVAQEKAIEYLNRHGSKPVNATKVDSSARMYITENGYSSIPHSLGHGIGLEVHEAPNISPLSKHLLKTHMVFSVEPGIYVPNFGGVRIEDIVVLEKSGPRLLTHAPKTLIEL